MEQTIKVSREGSRALTTAGDALDIRLEQILLHDRNPSIESDYDLGEDIMARLDCLSYWKNWLFGLSSDAGTPAAGNIQGYIKFDKGLPETLHDKQMTFLDIAEAILKTYIENLTPHPTLYGCLPENT
ncbi:hypothetical protein BDV30DRAFT_242519 [Aspergillus minisclerotigenes]|uniref:Uncharacterized protein n=1 Tax=Aspergillus minisclerotigenes TaxID=656917 RepID=A0A5N6ISI9_9EURO|nr:hypothetical protein BDV30DRAFT_242519 [Aspergillus minisclerotigenes]